MLMLLDFPTLNFEKGITFVLAQLMLIFVAGAIFLGILLAKKWIEEWFFPKKKSAPIDPSSMICQGCALIDYKSVNDLYRHSIFAFIRLARAVSIPNLPISDPGRKLVFEDLLDIKFRIVEDSLTEWIRDHTATLPKMPGAEMSARLVSLLARIIETYEEECLDRGIPVEVIEKFRFWHGKRVCLLQEEIEMVCGSEWISDAIHRVGFCLSVLEMILRSTTLDAEQALVSLNGSLCGKKYKGLLLGSPCHGKSHD
jgi:hypothetical protein